MVNLSTKVFVSLIGLAGLSIFGYCAYQTGLTQSSPAWVLLLFLSLLSGNFAIKLPRVEARISVSDTFTFTALLLYGPYVATVIGALDGLAMSLRFRFKPHRQFFNFSALAISAWISSQAFVVVNQILYRSPSVRQLQQLLIPLGAAALVHFVLNTGLVAAVLALSARTSVLKTWREHLFWVSISYFAGASAAALIYIFVPVVSIYSIAIAAPIILIIYFTYKTYLDKVSQAYAHVKELSRLHLSTIESLAMAIDAKDQCTHGHVRGVQVFATGLAQAMGIKDEKELRAIAAAALLHDVGKLAIPEYILNKPGKLTEAEYQKMKIHPAVGADILSTVNFPFPVVPYVRHHHERWDGSGYPDGLKGEEIPLGARIVAVADNYHALISDRPYRPALPREEALDIIRKNSGKMFDPRVVATLEEIGAEVEKQASELEFNELHLESLKTISKSSRDTEATPRPARSLTALKDISSSYNEVFALYEIAQILGTTLNLSETLLIIASKLGKILPFNTCVIYLFDRQKEQLVAEHATGDYAELFNGLEVPFGSKLTGWVVANNQPTINVDPSEDINRLPGHPIHKLCNAGVFPLSYEGMVMGAIAVYHQFTNSYTDDHLRIMEIVSRQASTAIHNALTYEETKEDALTDRLTGLPNSRYLYVMFEQELNKAKRYNHPITLFTMDLDGFKRINDLYGHPVGDKVLMEVAKILKSAVRASDIIIRYAGDEFMAVLTQTHMNQALPLVRRIQSSVEALRMEALPGRPVQVGLSIGMATFPKDGQTLEELMVKSDREMYRDKRERQVQAYGIALKLPGMD